jgi:Bacterial PH domain
MQSSNHFESTAPRYTPFSTSGLPSGSTATRLGEQVEGDTEDYPELTGDFPPAQTAVGPDPNAALESKKAALESKDETIENEQTLWEGQTSSKNFVVRFLVGETFTIAWVALAVATWGFGYGNLTIPTVAIAVALLLFWGLTGLKLLRAIHSHHYRLTTRRLFVRTGLFRRRIDQIELLRVKDIFVQQNLLGTWLGIGHVVVISSEQTLPRATLYGIERPRYVMDLIWLRTRAELDNKTSRIEQV